MSRFMHAADIHLDSPLCGLSEYEGAPIEAIRSATRRAFEAMIDLAIEKKVAFVLLAGDLYDGDWKDYNTGLFFTGQMARLNQAEIPAFVIRGNHDAQSNITRSLRPPPNVAVFSSKKPSTVTLDALGVAIHGQSYATAAVSEDLAAGYPEPVSGFLNIGLLHTSLDGRPGHAPYAPCSVDTLRSKGYQYWALGHVHTREVVSTNPHIVYTGCIQGRHVREVGPKGCTLVSFDEGEVSSLEHRDLDVLRWAECRVSIDTVDAEQDALGAIRAALCDALSGADDRPLAARVVLEGATELHTRMKADPLAWESQVRAVGAEIDYDRIWIEKVKVRTTGRRDLETTLAEGSPLAGLLSAIVEFPTVVREGDGLADEITQLKARLPPELFGGSDSIDLDDPLVVEAVIEEAKQHLIARLLSEEPDQ